MTELRRLGIRVLRNELVSIGNASAGFDLAGMDDRSAVHFGGHVAKRRFDAGPRPIAIRTRELACRAPAAQLARRRAVRDRVAALRPHARGPNLAVQLLVQMQQRSWLDSTGATTPRFTSAAELVTGARPCVWRRRRRSLKFDWSAAPVRRRADRRRDRSRRRGGGASGRGEGRRRKIGDQEQSRPAGAVADEANETWAPTCCSSISSTRSPGPGTSRLLTEVMTSPRRRPARRPGRPARRG